MKEAAPGKTDANLLDAPSVMEREIRSRVPELKAALDQLSGALVHFISSAHSNYPPDGPGGVPVVLSQVVNDFVDVLYDITSGRGRSALRGARSLFELMVTAKDVMTDVEHERRYVAHAPVVEQLEAELAVQHDELPLWARWAERRRRKMGRASKASYEQALSAYGKSFKRGWAPSDLASRATKHGLEREYNFYRLSSSVLHGSSGGVLGIRKLIEGRTVHRTGPALYLCPLAFLQALRYFDMTVETYEQTQTKNAITAEIRKSVALVRELWPKYYKALHKLDELTWPTAPPVWMIAVFVVTPDQAQWYLHDVVRGLVWVADPPEPLHPENQAFLDETARQFQHAGVPVASFAFFGMRVDPRPETAWEKDGWLMRGESPPT